MRGVDEGRKRASRLHTARPRSLPQSLTLRPQGPFVPSPPPLPTTPVPSLSLLGQIPPRPPSCPSHRPPGCPPVGRGGLPEAGGAVFSLVRHPCQKHLVYKLAAASRLLRTALGAGLTLPPALGAHPRRSSGSGPADHLLSRAPLWAPDLDLDRGDRKGRVSGGMLGSPTPGPAPASAPTGRVSVKNRGGQTQSTHRLCSPRPPRPLAGLPLRQGKSPVTGPGRLGPGGRGGTCAAPLPTYGCCRPRALLCQGSSEAGWGL